MNSPQQYKKFVKGPINLEWFEKASSLGGQTKAVNVGLLIWRYHNMNGSGEIVIPTQELTKLGIERHSYYRAIDKLEALQLIAVVRKSGAKCRITLIDKVVGHESDIVK